MVANFTVQLKAVGQHGNAKSNVWLYFGSLCRKDDGFVVDKDRLFCKPCLEELQKLPAISNILVLFSHTNLQLLQLT